MHNYETKCKEQKVTAVIDKVPRGSEPGNFSVSYGTKVPFTERLTGRKVGGIGARLVLHVEQSDSACSNSSRQVQVRTGNALILVCFR